MALQFLWVLGCCALFVGLQDVMNSCLFLKLPRLRVVGPGVLLKKHLISFDGLESAGLCR